MGMKHTHGLTAYKRIACVSFWTAANWIVIHNRAPGSYSTCSRAWIPTFLVGTRLILRTFSAHNTLRTTRRRASNVSRNTRADGLSIDFATLAIRTARRWTAWVRHNRCLLWSTLHECISGHSIRTTAHRNVIDHLAQCILTARARTRIYTFATNTGPIPSAVRVQDALWPAASVRIALVLWQTCANTVLALRISPAGRRIARIIIDGLRRC